MQTIFIQPLFAPDQKRFDRNMNSLMSLINYIKHYNYTDLKVAFGGWMPNDEYWKQFVTVINEHLGSQKITLKRYDRNYGKAIIVNDLYKTCVGKGVEFKYFMTADSDIIFPLETENMIERLEEAASKVTDHKKRDVGLIGLQQLEHCCHYHTINENKIEYINNFGKNEKVVWPNDSSGIAGGCLFIGRKFWDHRKGYLVYSNYGADDSTLLLGAGQLGYSWQVAYDIGIIHPLENDPEYQKKKIEICQRTFREGPKENIDKEIAEMDEFWKNHKIDA